MMPPDTHKHRALAFMITLELKLKAFFGAKGLNCLNSPPQPLQFMPSLNGIPKGFYLMN